MPAGSSVWATRRARALYLTSEAPHAEEILSTYADLLEVQERVARAVPVRRWLALVDAAESGPPRLRLDRLPVDELVPLFIDFLAGAADLGTGVMKADAGALSGSPGATWLGLLGAALTIDGTEEGPPFHVRAFLQPVATTLAAADGGRMGTARGGRCFMCGGAPAVGALQDLPDALGSRSLVCAVCGSAWRLPRLICAHCGEGDPEKLAVHTAESLPWIRLDECKSCGRYVKTMDLRKRGDAVPIVDDLATVELDLWAREQGLTRVQDNLFCL
jgi:formate dehydrogenase accessory protein FdhE